MENEDEIENTDIICPQCGIRQYNEICANCNIRIKDDEEKEKTKDDDDEYDYRERR